jgi:pyruvate dehydrogenase E1 component
MAFVRIKTLLKHPELGQARGAHHPDEARTFGMESLFREFGIYASQGQLYKPHDAEMFLYYKESQDGQILEEGITEAGSMASFTAAGRLTRITAHGDDSVLHVLLHVRLPARRRLIWAFADSRGKGFLMGGTAGRTTFGRRLAASGRPQPGAGQHRPHLRHLRSGLRL